MNIPESDNQMVANLIAFGAFLTTAIAAIYVVFQTRKANKIAKAANVIANKANSKADEANKIAIEANRKIEEANEMTKKALNISLHDHRVRITPILVAHLEQIMVWTDRPDDDYIWLKIKNKTHSTVKITHIELMSNLEITSIKSYPITLQFNGFEHIYLKFRNNIRSSFVNRAENDKSVYEQGEKAGNYIEDDVKLKMLIRNELLESTVIQIDYHDELNTTYYSNLRYDEKMSHFVGEPVQF